jgi:hypothetical protein
MPKKGARQPQQYSQFSRKARGSQNGLIGEGEPDSVVIGTLGITFPLSLLGRADEVIE